MNKKIYAGMITFGVAASFWACGSGEILKPDELTDKNALVIAALEDQEPTKLTEMVNLRVLDTLCPDCLKGTASSSSRAIPTPRSSSSRNPFVNSSSSSQLIINSATSSSTPPVYESSSSYNPGPVPVYSSSSSTPVVVGEDIGTCGPETPTVESGAKVIWVFKNGKDFPGNMMLNSDFTWTTSDANVPTATIGGYKGRIDTVTYAASGKHNASVSVFVKTSGVTYNISCTPVQVNGAPITGCKCTAADKNPDVSVGGSWTVTGCTSVGADIIGYEWLGAVGDGPTATQAFTKKNQMAAPVVNVSNNDNTVQPVQCDEVVSVDATDPDYVIDGTATGTFTVPVGVYKMVYACETSQYYQHSVIIEAPTGAVTATVEGKDYTIAQNGRASVYKSTETNVPIDVEIVSGSAKISCE